MHNKASKQKKNAETKISEAEKRKLFSNVKNTKARQQLFNHKRKTESKVSGVSGEKTVYLASALGPTRVVIPIEFPDLLGFLGYIAQLMSYEIQTRAGLPQFDGATNNSEWNPSKVLAYLLAIYGMKFAKLGVLEVSSSFRTMGDYLVPTFVAKHLQQICPSTHMGREVSLQVSVTTDQILNNDCGSGGLPPAGASVGAPCAIFVANDTEPWFQYTNPIGTPITPGSLSVTDYGKLSAVISRVFKRTVKVSDIPDRASSNELKICPVATSQNSQLVYCCLDDKTMCDLILPLASFNTNVLVNSPNPLQSAAPVRVDGSASMCPEAKIAFLFWLANKQEFDKGDSFLTYIRKFGVQDRNLGNIQLNLRQVNWTSVMNMVFNYCKALTSLDAVGAWYFAVYLVCVIHANIPGCFRAFTPIKGDFNISKQFKDLPQISNYKAALENPKIPPFVANVIKGLRQPIRSGNQITFFYGQMPDSGVSFPWWVQIATTAAGSFPQANYGDSPVPMEYCGFSWNSGPYKPYPFFTAGVPPSNSWRNYVPIRGAVAIQTYLSNNLQQAGAQQQNLFNQWSDKIVQFNKRHARFYLPCKVADLELVYPGPGGAFAQKVPVPELVSSWEPVGYATALLSAANMLTYYMPSDTAKPLLPVFSTVPNEGVEDAVGTSMLAANPGQGSQQAIQIGKAQNPAEVQAHLAADSTAGALSNHSTPVPKEHMKKVDKVVHNMVHTGVEDAKEAGAIILKDGGELIADGASKILGVLA